jgi:hypothetical protein
VKQIRIAGHPLPLMLRINGRGSRPTAGACAPAVELLGELGVNSGKKE